MTKFLATLEDLKRSGQIFGGVYRKKDGSITKFNGRFGVHKFSNGGVRTTPDSYALIWDNNRKRYTALIPENIIQINAYGCTYYPNERLF
jgi:hypothetical protein